MTSNSKPLAISKPKKNKKKNKSVAKLLQLPEAPLDRLNVLHARLGLPKPCFTIAEQSRCRATLMPPSSNSDGGSPSAQQVAVIKTSNKYVVTEPWSSTAAKDKIWHPTHKEAMRQAAADACSALEAQLVAKVTAVTSGEVDGGPNAENEDDYEWFDIDFG